MPSTDINLTLPIDQVNLALALLGSHPFNQVADLIVGIRQQAGPQVAQMQPQIDPPRQVPAPPVTMRGNGEDRDWRPAT